MASNPQLLNTPLAINGNRNAIPAEQRIAGDGLFSESTGFPQETSLPLGSGGVAPRREDMNGAFYLLSQLTFAIQKGWMFQYDPSQAYWQGCVVVDPADNNPYLCLADVAAGTIEPHSDTQNVYWRLVDYELDYRQKSTNYEVGTVRRLKFEDCNIYLTCTTAGTTSDEDLFNLPEGVTVDGSFTDGSVVWGVNEVASKAFVKQYVRERSNLTLSATNVDIIGTGTIKTVTASWEGDGELSVTSDAPTVATATVSGRTITITGTGDGEATIVVNLSASGDYGSDVAFIFCTCTTRLDANLEVTPTALTFKVARTAQCTATYEGNGELTATVADTSVATVDVQGNVITVTGVSAGNTILTVSTSQTSTYLADEKTVALTVQTAQSANLTLSAQTINVVQSQTGIITASWNGSGTLSATSSDPSIASVAVSGTQLVVVGLANGTVTITANVSESTGYYDDSATATATVKYASNLSVSPTSLSIKVARSKTFTATYNGSGTLTATSNNTNIARVTKSGNTFTVSGVAAGSTSITVTLSATDDYFGATQTVSITVQTAQSPNLTLSSTTAKVNKGKTTTITASYNGTGTLTATSSAPSIAGVTVTGTLITITGIAAGSATITVNLSEAPGYYDASATIATTVTLYRVMTVYINQNDSNPATCCSYGDDAVNMTPGSDEWDEWFGEYPVLFKEGKEVGKLNPNNFAQFADGTAADITSGNAGDVMIAFPRRGLTISTDENNVVKVSMTDDPSNTDFGYYAHQRGTTQKDVFYLGAYKGYVDADNKLRSLSGKTQVNSTISRPQLRTYARALGAPDGNGGSGYDLSAFFQLTFRQAMYVLKYANLNARTTIGYGYFQNGTPSTGTTNSEGMTYGVTNSTFYQMKLFGIEDWWGNRYEHIDGILISPGRHIYVATENFADSTAGYTDAGEGGEFNLDRVWITEVQGVTTRGFIIKKGGGSATTYFCNTGSLYGDNTYNLPLGIYTGQIANFLAYHVIGSGTMANSSGRLMYL